MLEVVSNASPAPAGAASLPPPLPPSDATPLELKVEPADAIFGPAPLKERETEKASPREGIGFFGRLFRFVARTTAVVLLCALAWAAGTFYSHGHWSSDPLKSAQVPQAQAGQVPQALQSPAHADMASAMQQMADDVRALKASVDNKAVTPDAGAQNAQRGQLDSAQTTAVANLAGRVDKLETDVTAKLSQVSEQLASIQQQLTASHAALAARRAAVHKHEHVHDAFNPSQDPGAPGAPHPLGSAW